MPVKLMFVLSVPAPEPVMVQVLSASEPRRLSVPAPPASDTGVVTPTNLKLSSPPLPSATMLDTPS